MGSSKPLRVLSIDGGGMRGVYSATYLHRLMSDIRRRHKVSGPEELRKSFHLVVGTSTGAILACAIVANVPLPDVVELYRNSGPKIFQQALPEDWWGIPRDLRSRSSALAKGTSEMHEALTKAFGEKTIGEIYDETKVALAIPATDLATGKSWVFKTQHLTSSMGRDNSTTLVDACLASSAAPLYRSLALLKLETGGVANERVFIDGGLWANNPVLVALTEALEMSSDNQPIEVYCVGTCARPSGQDKVDKDGHWDLKDWKFGGRVPEFSISAQEFAYDNMARMIAKHLRNRCSIVRLPKVDVPSERHQYLGLDDARKEAIQALISQAHSDADRANRWCQEEQEGQSFERAVLGIEHED